MVHDGKGFIKLWPKGILGVKYSAQEVSYVHGFRKLIALLVPLLLLLPVSNPASAAELPALRWRWVNPAPTGNHLRRVVYADGQFVAVGQYGTIVHSADGTGWTAAPALTLADLNGIAYGNGRYVTVGDAGTILTSRDGKSWTPAPSHSAADLLDVAFGDGRFVAVGTDGTVLSSPDGQTWSAVPTGVTGPVEGVAYGNGRFVLGGQRALVLQWSSSGWSVSRSERYISKKLVFTNGYFWASGGYVMLKSADGLNWEYVFGSNIGRAYEEEPPTATSPDSLRLVEFTTELEYLAAGDGLYVLPANGGHEVLLSHDSLHWRKVGTEYYLGQPHITYGAGRFVMVGNDGQVLASTDGETWNRVHATPVGQPHDVIFAEGRFVLIEKLYGNKDARIYTSTDGINWTAVTGPGWGGWNIAYGGGRFVVASGGAWVAWSDDGQRWQSAKVPVPYALETVAYGNGRFVAGGSGSSLAVSADGVTWKQVTNAPTGDIIRIRYLNDQFVLLAAEGEKLFDRVSRYYTSRDGENWTLIEPGMDRVSIDAYGNGRYVGRCIVDKEAGTGLNIWGICWSTDLRNWHVAAPNIGYYSIQVHRVNGEFIAAGSYADHYYRSADGLNWTAITPIWATPDDPSFAYGNGRYVAVGWGKLMVADGPGYPSDKPPVAAKDVRVTLNGRPVPVEVVIVDGHSLVPVRSVSELLGAAVRWDGERRTALITKGDDLQVELTIGVDRALVNGEPVELAVPAVLYENQTRVPLRFLTEALGARVEWDGSTQRINLITE